MYIRNRAFQPSVFGALPILDSWEGLLPQCAPWLRLCYVLTHAVNWNYVRVIRQQCTTERDDYACCDRCCCAWSVCMYVCLSPMHPAIALGQNMPFGRNTRVVTSNTVLDTPSWFQGGRFAERGKWRGGEGSTRGRGREGKRGEVG